MTIVENSEQRLVEVEAPRPQGVSVTIERLQKTYATRGGDEVRALEYIDIRIEAGQFVSVVGPSGCGKSTLLMIMAGLVPSSEGVIRIDHEPVARPYPQMAMVFQSDLLLKWRTVLDNILLPVEIKNWDSSAYRERAVVLMDQVGLQDFAAKFPDELSGGMRQRVAICRALVQQPRLLLMDEPFGSLDALTREQMAIDLLHLWQQISNTVVFVTHSIDEAVFMSDRVLVMSPRPGRIDVDLKISLPRPRRWAMRRLPEFLSYQDMIRQAFEARGVLKESSAKI
jgi:NitT/TauT family transport system ATP-binding protein